MKLAELAVNGSTDEIRYLAKAMVGLQEQGNQIVLQLQRHQLLIELMADGLAANKLLFETIVACQNVTPEQKKIIEDEAEHKLNAIVVHQTELMKKVKELQ